MPESNRSKQFSLRQLGCFIAIVAIVVALERYLVAPGRIKKEIEELLLSLRTRQPPDMSNLEWEIAVRWTTVLNANSILPGEVDASTLARFKTMLQTELSKEDIGMMTIHWIWEKYEVLCDSGKEYQRFKPIMLEEIASVRKYGGGMKGTVPKGKNKKRTVGRVPPS